ncbi:hypothetical protein T4B_2156 [Trichinella pseudospiralis]|uniref:Uncharacterized protein n=1 Tax=Trichinella pseudospiralis TaxID=6337 RepID=A0A0V1GMW8_TRIPS|nr:hypothetical protein T4B_2156 [Trichinella pseudospiralis]
MQIKGGSAGQFDNIEYQEAESTESVIICIHGTRLPSGEEATSSADRSD